MSRRKKKQEEKSPIRPINSQVGTAGKLGGLALAAFFITWWITNLVNESPASPAVAETTPAPVVTPGAKSTPLEKTVSVDFRPLEGKWIRPDGGYVLEIRSVGRNGKLDAAYFNPRPINVASAHASREGDRLNVAIELRDTNYPGSLYQLTYDRASDSLTGSYFQATQQQQFEVAFSRAK